MQQTLLAEQDEYIKEQRKSSWIYKASTFALGALAISLLIKNGD